MIEMNDADWELFVPVKGEKYPDVYEVRERSSSLRWRKGGVPGSVVYDPESHLFEYRKPKQKGNKMPDRTSQQALKDAIDSGAVEACINGEPIQLKPHGKCDDWTPANDWYDFANPLYEFRPAPPEPTRINWRPVVKGREPEGWVLCLWHGNHPAVRNAWYNGSTWVNDEGSFSRPTHWAPMCNLPEGDK